MSVQRHILNALVCTDTFEQNLIDDINIGKSSDYKARRMGLDLREIKMVGWLVD